MKRKTIYDIDYWIEKGLSSNDAKIRIEILKKETSWRCVEFWIKRGYNRQESIDKIRIKQREISNKRDKNKKIKNPYNEQYYIDKGITDLDEIKKLIQIRKDKSNPYLKWNNDDLNNVLQKRRETYYSKTKDERYKINKKRGINKKELLEKFGIEYTERLLKNRGNKNRSRFDHGKSNISIELFDTLSEMNNDKIFLFGKNEKFILLKGLKNKRGLFVDFLYEERKKIIEFNGDFWHFNPEKYLPESFTILNGNKIIAKDIWNSDEIKLKKLKNVGYDVLVIWENDYKKDKKHIINICNNFINT